MSIPVFANHAHVFPESVNPDGTIDRLLRLYDACGIAGGVAFAPFAHQLIGRGLHHNDWLAKAIARQPRLQGFGTVDFLHHVDLRPVKRALELHASAIIMVHNHPSGDPKPSRADVEMTRQVRDAAQAVGIALHDHLVIGKSGHSSFKSMGLL